MFDDAVPNGDQTATSGPYTGASVTDQLDGVLDDGTYGGATASSGSLSYTSPDLTWTGNLAVGAAATITYAVTVHDPDTGDRALVDSVISAAAGSNCPLSGGSDSRCTVTVQDLVPGLQIVKTADVATTTPGSVVHFTITVTNTGQTAYTGATFTDPLSGVVDDATYNNNATATVVPAGPSAGSATFTSPDLTWTGNLAIGAVVTVTYSVTVHSPDTGNEILANTITSATPGNNCPSGGTETECSATVKVAQLALLGQANVSTTTPGGVVAYTFTFTNTGQVPYTRITVLTNASGIVDDATSNGDTTATSGVASVTGGGGSWTGDIPVGGAVTVTGSVTVRSPDTGNKTLTATLTSTAPGNNCPSGSGDPACTVTVTLLTQGLTITKAADTAAAAPGAAVGYTITVTNSGQTPYVGATVTDPLTGVLDDGTYNGDKAASTGTVTYASSTLTWTGDLAVGASATITYSVTVDSPDTGTSMHDEHGHVRRDRAATARPASGAAGCTATVQVLTPALTIAKTAERGHGGARRHRHLHDHRRQHRPDRIYRRDRSPTR